MIDIYDLTLLEEVSIGHMEVAGFQFNVMYDVETGNVFVKAPDVGTVTGADVYALAEKLTAIIKAHQDGTVWDKYQFTVYSTAIREDRTTRLSTDHEEITLFYDVEGDSLRIVSMWVGAPKPWHSTPEFQYVDADVQGTDHMLIDLFRAKEVPPVVTILDDTGKRMTLVRKEIADRVLTETTPDYISNTIRDHVLENLRVADDGIHTMLHRTFNNLMEIYGNPFQQETQA